MKPTSSCMLISCRKILQAADLGTLDGIPDTSLSPVTADHTTTTTSAAVRRPFNPDTPLDSSMALTILVLLTALFFLGFFSVYIRRLSGGADDTSPPSSASRLRPPPSNHKGGLDASVVSSLPLMAYGKGAKHPMIDDCPICLTEFYERETVKLIPYCSHVFHPTCIDTWLSSHVTCPLCRSAQLFKPVEELCLDVTDDRNPIGTSDISTVHGTDTSRDEGSAEEMSRTPSSSNMGNRAVLH